MTDLSKNNITQFCKSLSSNNFDESKQLFLSLHPIIQKMFLHWAWEILSHKSKYPYDTYLTSFKIFKLFNGKETQQLPLYNQYISKPLFKTLYSNASLTFKESSKSTPKKSPSKKSPSRKSPSRKSPSRKSPSRKYEKEYQKYEEPENESDPLYIYYTTLRKQNPESKLAIKWLTEHGVYEDEERNELVEEYKNLTR